MSFIEPNVTPATEPAPAAPQQPGVADVVAQPAPVAAPPSEPVAGVTSEPEKKYLSVDDYGDHYVKIKVDGVEKELPFSQVRDGIMMQEAFTKRTQELANERRQLHAANALMASLEADGPGTVRQLAEAYDLDPNGLVPVQREPQEQALIDQRRALAAQQAEFTRQRIDYEVNHLMNDYGVSEADLPNLVDAAIRMGTDLETAYKALAFERYRQQQTVPQPPAAPARQAALDAQVVHSGSTTQRGAVAEPPAKVNNIQDAWALAKKELNLS